MNNYLRLALATAISAALIGCGPEDVSNIDAVDSNKAVSNTEKVNYDKALDGENSTPAESNPYSEMDDGSNTQSIDYGANTSGNNDSIITDETKAKGMAMFGAGVDAAVAGINKIDKRQLEDIKTTAISKVDGAVKGYQASGNSGTTSSSTTNFDNTWKTTVASGVRVIDGDTVELKYNDGRKSDRVRLIGIDAPEFKYNNPASSQEYGEQSKDTLQSCVDGGDVNVHYQEEDKYGRLLGVVLAGKTDCNYIQVQKGSAWHYKQYAKNQPNGAAQVYAMAENDARSVNKGLWASTQPQEPWLFRRTNK